MPSFLEKLKKSMKPREHILSIPKKDIKKPAAQADKINETPKRSEISLNTTELKIQQKPLEIDRPLTKTKLLIKSESLNNNKELNGEDASSLLPRFANTRAKEKWFEQEGYLTVDIYQTETDLIIQTAIAGIKPEDLDITMEKDLMIIKGTREGSLSQEEKKDYFIQECYWGPFSRKIVLPVEINPDQAQASMKQGVLIIRLPKTLREKNRKIEIRE